VRQPILQTGKNRFYGSDFQDYTVFSVKADSPRTPAFRHEKRPMFSPPRFPQLILVLIAIAVLFAPGRVAAQSKYTWNSGVTNSAWLNSFDWFLSVGGGNPNGYPGEIANAASTNTDIAAFGNYTSTVGSAGIGIDMGAAGANGNLVLGAIDFNPTTATNGLFIGNSSTATNGVLTLNGATVNVIANVLIAVRGNRDLTIQNTQGSGNKTLGLRLGITNGRVRGGERANAHGE